jgi:hypothetical protein
MSSGKKAHPVRLPLTDKELERLTAYDFGKVKLTEDEKLRLRAINEGRRQEAQRKGAEWARAEVPLVQELRAAGVPVESVWDLVNAGRKRPSRTFKISTDPPEAIWDWLDANGRSLAAIVPLLLEHLQRPYPDRVRAGIARALAVREARSAWPLLVKLYRQERGDWSRDGLAVALGNIADDDVVDELIALVKDPQNGRSRVLLLDALRRSRLPQARMALMEFGTDPVLQKEALRILHRRSKRAKR